MLTSTRCRPPLYPVLCTRVIEHIHSFDDAVAGVIVRRRSCCSGQHAGCRDGRTGRGHPLSRARNAERGARERPTGGSNSGPIAGDMYQRGRRTSRAALVQSASVAAYQRRRHPQCTMATSSGSRSRVNDLINHGLVDPKDLRTERSLGVATPPAAPVRGPTGIGQPAG